MKHFMAELSAFERNGEGDQSLDDTVVAVEVLSFDKDGTTLGFNDRNERVYLRFRLSHLVSAIEAHDRDA